MDELFSIMPPSTPNLAQGLANLRHAGVTTVIIGLPWAMLKPHEAQAQKNHHQTLERLHERGGLSACEALAILEDRKWRAMPEAKAYQELYALYRHWVFWVK